MTATTDRRIDHIQRALTSLAVAHGHAMVQTAAEHQDASDIARAALAVAAKPGPSAPAPGKRIHSATERRVEQTKALIAEFSKRDMTVVEVRSFLEFTPSGARKYIQALRDAGVIELARYIGGTDVCLGAGVFRLSPDAQRVSAFIASLSAPRGTVQRLAKLPPAGTPGRHFHIMGDDVPYSVRAWRGQPSRDPLVAALFGPARAEVRA